MEIETETKNTFSYLYNIPFTFAYTFVVDGIKPET